MPTVTLYTKPHCPLCDQARAHLTRVLTEPAGAGWTVDEVSILDDQALYRAYRYRIPVIAVEGGVTLVAPLSLYPELMRRALAPGRDGTLVTAANVALAEAADERRRMEAEEAAGAATTDPLPPAHVDTAPAAAAPQPPAAGPTPPPAVAVPAPLPPTAPIAGAPVYAPYAPAPPLHGPLRGVVAGVNWLVGHVLEVMTGVLGVWVILPWLAPIFAHLGWWGPADLIYTGYIFFCHQLPERAASLFGYQVAWCWRNSAIYSSVFVTGVLWLWLGRAGHGPRWFRGGVGWPVLLLCAIPVAMDGFSHMFGLRTDNAWFDTLTGGRFGDFSVGDTFGTLNWTLRVTTGVLFGVAAGLFVYPIMQRTMQDDMLYAGRRYPAAAPRPAAPAL